MTEEELVEKVARAIYAAHGYIYTDNARIFEPFPWEEADDCVKVGHKLDARAAIAAMREAGAVFPPAPGQVLVVETLSQEEAAAAVFSVLNHPTRI